MHGVQSMPCRAERLRRPLPARRPVALAGRLRQGGPRRGGRPPRPLRRRDPDHEVAVHLYPVDGAAHDVAPGDTAWSYRDARWATVYAGVDPDPGERRDDPRLERRLHGGAAPVFGRRPLREHDDGGESQRVRASYRDNCDTLARIKGKYDPDNLFHHQPEHPAAQGALPRPDPRRRRSSRLRGGTAQPGRAARWPAQDARRPRSRRRSSPARRRACAGCLDRTLTTQLCSSIASTATAAGTRAATRSAGACAIQFARYAHVARPSAR